MGDLTLGQYIRKERINYMSLRSFAKELGVSASYLSDVELGRRKVNKDMVMRVAIQFSFIVGGSNHKRYDTMLSLSGLMTPERKCLIEVMEWLDCQRYDQHDPAALAYYGDCYDALYEKFDIGMYGFPVRKVGLGGGK